ncbi:DBH-like monooxygenase protein 1 [Chionoecetes opilio]|uniref:DBH-like monooxygenase protein 1 n=1 Tax=Chionoecetes opilio TaxID=41210 RepID=A0A8J5D4U2_CHIOP|nr:DBH-like monooxygenase protein 1 [Chionoecetes opilio]
MDPNTTPQPPPQHPNRYFLTQASQASLPTTPASPVTPEATSQVLRVPRYQRATPYLAHTPGFSLHLAILTVLLLLVPQTRCFTDPSFTAHGLSPSSYETYKHEVWLEETGAFVVQWTPRQDDIEFRVTARTTGYLGFGLSSKPKMDGADIVLGALWQAYLQDRHGRGNNEPAVDQQRDWLLVGGYENDTHTVLIMSRPYNTCDSHDHVISNDTVRLLWAYHQDDPVDPESPRPRLHYHGGARRGVKTIFLLERGNKTPVPSFPYYLPGVRRPPPPPPQSFPHATTTSQHHHHHHHHHQRSPSTHTWLLTNPGVVVEEKDDTVYWCKVFRRPELIQKNHVIRYEPVFTPGNEQYVHHIIVYECTDLEKTQQKVFEKLAASAGSGCYETEILQHIETCNHVVVTWAVGSEVSTSFVNLNNLNTNSNASVN